MHTCRCGAEQKLLACADRDWACGRVCGATLACGRHFCQLGCHAGGSHPRCLPPVALPLPPSCCSIPRRCLRYTLAGDPLLGSYGQGFSGLMGGQRRRGNTDFGRRRDAVESLYFDHQLAGADGKYLFHLWQGAVGAVGWRATASAIAGRQSSRPCSATSQHRAAGRRAGRCWLVASTRAPSAATPAHARTRAERWSPSHAGMQSRRKAAPQPLPLVLSLFSSHSPSFLVGHPQPLPPLPPLHPFPGLPAYPSLSPPLPSVHSVSLSASLPFLP